VLDERVRRRVEGAVVGRALRAELARQSRRPRRERLDEGLRYASVYRQTYPDRDWAPVMTDVDGLDARGEAAYSVVREADDHDLDMRTAHEEHITSLDRRLSSEPPPDWEPVRPTPVQLEALVRWAHRRSLAPGSPETTERLITLLTGVAPGGRAEGEVAGADTPAPEGAREARDVEAAPTELRELRAALVAHRRALTERARLQARLELYVVDATLRYGRHMKFHNLSRQDWRDLKRAGGSIKLIYGRVVAFFEELAETPAAETRALVLGLEPRHPQYRRLVEARRRYLAVEAAGGWPDVERFAVEAGRRGAKVARLRRRLRAEGFLGAPSAGASSDGAPADSTDQGASSGGDAASGDDVVDEALLDAVRDYRAAHQLGVEGGPSTAFWEELDVPIRRRIESIELALERWRESQYDGERDFVMVNIPDFHAEVWRAGRREMRFRVVVGDATRTCDEESGEWVWPNRTPVQMAEMNRMILNPYWYVPDRIVDEEFAPKIERNPDWLAENGYEIVEVRSGAKRVRQKPGDDSALGRVKFLFPNPHNTYMHDTRRKELFAEPVRAFSHGCMRVQEPLALARYLARVQERDDVDVDAVVQTDRQKVVDFDDPLPVFTVYITTRVDDRGRVHFLEDIYLEDARRRSPDPEAFDRCRPADESAR
jgi:murein L,D-transpeptidase YcbB/YkuD